eukprot:31330_1
MSSLQAHLTLFKMTMEDEEDIDDSFCLCNQHTISILSLWVSSCFILLWFSSAADTSIVFKLNATSVVKTQNVSFQNIKQNKDNTLCFAPQAPFTLNRGLWVVLPYNECTMSYSENNSLYKWYDEEPDATQKRYTENIMIPHHKDNLTARTRNESIAKSINKSTITIDDKYTAIDIQYCDGYPLYDKEQSMHWTVYYLVQQKCYYRIYTEQQKDACFTNKSILFLGDSTMEDLAFAIKQEDKWIKGGKTLLSYKHNETSAKYNLTYLFLPPDRKTGVGLYALHQQNSMQMIKNVILENNIKIIIFNSLLHDTVRQSWNTDDPPFIYYDLLQQLWLWLFSECEIETLYLWTGINPTYRGRYKNIVWYFPLYIRALVNAANNFTKEHTNYLLKLIDTAHVSDGHRNDHYSDGVHYGQKPNEVYGMNTSLLVENMTVQIVLNNLCN